MSLDFRSRLGRALGLQLPATFAFEYCSIDAVTDYLSPCTCRPGPHPCPPSPRRPAQEARRAARDIRAVAQRTDRRAGRGTERYRELLVHRTAGRLETRSRPFMENETSDVSKQQLEASLAQAIGTIRSPEGEAGGKDAQRGRTDRGGRPGLPPAGWRG
ncbi:acyl carrier protein [Pseudomonas aeruginosa]